MKKNVLYAAVAILAGSPCFAIEPQLTGFPFTNEDLTYRINLPTGQQIGNGHLRASRSGRDWNFELAIDGGIPGYAVNDVYKGVSNADFCSSEFSKNVTHGSRKGIENDTVDRASATASRKTVLNGGGKSEFPVPDCARDALGLLFYARRELGQGRVAPSQQMLFGSLYFTQITYTGPETIQFGGKATVTDRVVVNVKGPASSRQFEILFARDAARTPLLFRVPLLQGASQITKFTMELVR